MSALRSAGDCCSGRLEKSAENAFARADHYDEDGAFPSADVDALHESGLLTAVLPVKCGGAGLSGFASCEILQSIGSGSLPLGRLFEGHVNALELVLRYGNHRQVELVAGRSEGRQVVRRLEHRRCERAAADPQAWALLARRAEKSWPRAQATSNARWSQRPTKTDVD